MFFTGAICGALFLFGVIVWLFHYPLNTRWMPAVKCPSCSGALSGWRQYAHSDLHPKIVEGYGTERICPKCGVTAEHEAFKYEVGRRVWGRWEWRTGVKA